jgi:hypothetical protein
VVATARDPRAVTEALGVHDRLLALAGQRGPGQLARAVAVDRLRRLGGLGAHAETAAAGVAAACLTASSAIARAAT